MSEVSSSNWSETAASNTAATPNGWPEGQSPGSINDCAREMMSALKKFWGRIQGRYASTGSANAYVLTPDVALSAYVTGERYSFRANFANTGSATLNISSLGAKTIKKLGSSGATALTGGEIQSGQPVTVEYDGTDLLMVTPIAAGSTIAVTAKNTPVALVQGSVSGGTLTTNKSFNCSVARNSGGNFTVTFTSALSDANYLVIGTADGGVTNVLCVVVTARSTSAFTFVTTNTNGSAAGDPNAFSVAVFSF